MSGADAENRAPTHIVSCPTCRRSVPWKPESRYRPFCSKRCQLIDLGAWADGSHAIPGDPHWGDDGDGDPEAS